MFLSMPQTDETSPPFQASLMPLVAAIFLRNAFVPGDRAEIIRPCRLTDADARQPVAARIDLQPVEGPSPFLKVKVT
jgi:hypothetical protein